MKFHFILLLNLLLSTILFSQETQIKELQNFNRVSDSLLIALNKQITTDLAAEGIYIIKQTPEHIQFDGNIMLLELFFTPNCSYILGYYGITSRMVKKVKKQRSGFRFRKHMYMSAVTDFVETNNKFPVEYITYKIIAPYHDSPGEQAIFGEYGFKLNEDEKYEIVHKSIEILKNQEAISVKHRTTF